MDWKVGNHLITVTHEGLFQVDDGPTCETLAGANAEAERILKQELAESKNKPLSLAVVDTHGHSGTITGIHRGTSKLLIVPPCPQATRYSHEAWYVPNPAVSASLSRLAEAKQEVERLSAKLRRCEILVNTSGSEHGYRSVIPADEYPARVAELVAVYDKAAAAASELEKQG